MDAGPDLLGVSGEAASSATSSLVDILERTLRNKARAKAETLNSLRAAVDSRRPLGSDGAARKRVDLHLREKS